MSDNEKTPPLMIKLQCNGEAFKMNLEFETLNVMTKSYEDHLCIA